MNTLLCLQNEQALAAPAEAQIGNWIEAALAAAGHRGPAELTIRIASAEEVADLNLRYRHKPGPTNVLSFPAELPEWLDEPMLGDIIICAEIALQEAQDQGKSAEAHWAHLVIHGVLHLLGYDHINDHDAITMEALETRVLASIGYPDPYLVTT